MYSSKLIVMRDRVSAYALALPGRYLISKWKSAISFTYRRSVALSFADARMQVKGLLSVKTWESSTSNRGTGQLLPTSGPETPACLHAWRWYSRSAGKTLLLDPLIIMKRKFFREIRVGHDRWATEVSTSRTAGIFECGCLFFPVVVSRSHIGLATFAKVSMYRR